MIGGGRSTPTMLHSRAIHHLHLHTQAGPAVEEEVAQANPLTLSESRAALQRPPSMAGNGRYRVAFTDQSPHHTWKGEPRTGLDNCSSWLLRLACLALLGSIWLGLASFASAGKKGESLGAKEPLGWDGMKGTTPLYLAVGTV